MAMTKELPASRQATRFWALALTAALASGCAALRPANTPLDRIDPETGYRPAHIVQSRPIGDIAFSLAFSGGGTRAAALAYGALLELRDTLITVRGERKRLLDEVDTITSVSGGSFTAAYYGLHGDGIFADFEQRFLKRNVERDLLLRMLLPHNWIRLILPFYDRSELAITYYDQKIFDGARFSDLAAAGGPYIQINSTDLTAGARFPFVQPQFDLICSDLSPLEVARAVTASSAVPVAFAPIVLKNFAGSCGYEKPAWLEESLASREQYPRRYHVALEMNAYLDREAHRYLHLVDGGIADNLGVRGPLDNIILEGGLWERLEDLAADRPRHVVFIVVNAATEPDHSFALVPKPPSLAAMIGSITDTQLHRYNYETMDLLHEKLGDWAKNLPPGGAAMKTHLVEVAEYAIDDPEEREFFNGVPTTLALDEETVDRLIALGRRLLRESEVFQNLVTELHGTAVGDGDSNGP